MEPIWVEEEEVLEQSVAEVEVVVETQLVLMEMVVLV
jgi:hypothetical protein